MYKWGVRTDARLLEEAASSGAICPALPLRGPGGRAAV